MSPTANGLNRVSTIAAVPRELSPSVRLKTAFEQYVRISIIPERTTDGVKPVTAIKQNTIAKIIEASAYLFLIIFFNRNKTNPAIIAKCIPETTIRKLVPVFEKSAFISSESACLSPSKTALQSDEVFSGNKESSELFIAFLTLTAMLYRENCFSPVELKLSFSSS